jgi:hypothetical protein
MRQVASCSIAVPGECQATRRVVELHRRRIEACQIVATRQPSAPVFVHSARDDLRKGMHTAAVLRWAGTLAADAARVGECEIAPQHIDQRDGMLPVIAEVVFIASCPVVPSKHRGHLGSPAGRILAVLVQVVDAEDHRLLCAWMGDGKAMQMIVQPAHRVLDHHMQIPECIVARHLDRAPYERIGLQQFDSEAQDERLRRVVTPRMPSGASLLAD